MYDEVEEHNIVSLRLLERSRNCELMGGELMGDELWSVNDKDGN